MKQPFLPVKELPLSAQRMGGIVLLVAGVILFVIGVNASDSFADRWSNFFTGSYTDQTVWLMGGGAILAVGGFLLMIFGGGRKLIA